MKIHEKITTLRKRQGWSQEMLAEKLDVSRQAVSKWESGASLPELTSIVRMAELFGVTTDEFLRDGDTSPSCADVETAEESVEIHTPCREDVEAYLEAVRRGAPRIALGVLLCILSPIALLLLLGLADMGNISAPLAVGLGIAAILLLVAAALFLFIPTGMRLSSYEKWKKGKLLLSPSVTEGLRETKASAERTAVVGITVGVVLCVLSPVTLIVFSILSLPTLPILTGISALLLFVAVGVYLMVRVALPTDAYHCLFREGEYKTLYEKSRKAEIFSLFYWPLLTAAYLLVSFLSGEWGITWLFWPIGAFLFTAVETLLEKKSKD